MELHEDLVSSGEVHPICGQHHDHVQWVSWFHYRPATGVTKPHLRPARSGSIRFNVRERFQDSEL